jgi:hypothetical protein
VKVKVKQLLEVAQLEIQGFFEKSEKKAIFFLLMTHFDFVKSTYTETHILSSHTLLAFRGNAETGSTTQKVSPLGQFDRVSHQAFSVGKRHFENTCLLLFYIFSKLQMYFT